MTENTSLTKKEQQELRGAEARLSRIEKLQQQLEEARLNASQGTIKKIEDINSQSEKLAERILKVQEQVDAAVLRKQALVARQDELIKAKYVLADEIAEYLTPSDHERLHLDTPENVEDNTFLTTAQVEEIADSAAQAEEEEVDEEVEEDNGPSMVMEEEPAPKRDLRAEMDADLAAAKKQDARKRSAAKAK